jgi:CheY-like chemotaxis protein
MDQEEKKMDTLQQKADQLEEESRRKDDFIAILSHELRNPLAPILSCLEVCRKTDQQRNPEVINDCYNIIERQVKNMAQLLDELLDVSRIRTGKIKIQHRPVQVQEVVRASIEQAKPRIEMRYHHLHVSMPAEPVWVEGDPVRLEQIFANILHNAAKYTEPGGNIYVRLDGSDTDQVEISIRDTGIGISGQMLPHIFDLFFQTQKVLERNQGGLGIGLSLVHQLVTMHGGKIEATSDGLNRGSEFTVTLPRTGPMKEAVAVLTEDHKPHLTSRFTGVSCVKADELRILVVDDNVDAADSLVMLLRMEGHEVFAANDGNTALKIASDVPLEIVLLDIGMPGLDGYSTCEQLLRIDDKLRVIAITGFGQEKDRQRAQQAGFVGYLVKPVDPSKVGEEIRRHQKGCQ